MGGVFVQCDEQHLHRNAVVLRGGKVDGIEPSLVAAGRIAAGGEQCFQHGRHLSAAGTEDQRCAVLLHLHRIGIEAVGEQEYKRGMVALADIVVSDGIEHRMAHEFTQLQRPLVQPEQYGHAVDVPR